jgi:hypothetical protein
LNSQPPSTKIWSTTIPLQPGTHHVRYIVDGVWRVAETLPTAVDDEGSLSNYVSVHLSGTPPSPPPPVKQIHQLTRGQSFFSTTSTTSENESITSTNNPILAKSGSRGKFSKPIKWTDEFPPELIAAANEEEEYLDSSESIDDDYSEPALLGRAGPDVPPAPAMPRHLDKLILNAKREEGRAGGGGSAGRSAMREREREREERRQARSALGMTSTHHHSEIKSPSDGRGGGGEASTHRSLDSHGVADDASVLPVPSHVVLHHLSTSAIKNGVLAVANTTRYKEKVRPHFPLFLSID